jgi:hypothetical protein
MRASVLRCLGAASGNKPYPGAVCRTVLSTDVQESLRVGTYWLLLTVDMLLPDIGGPPDQPTVPQRFR